jgi:hypothetical protein
MKRGWFALSSLNSWSSWSFEKQVKAVIIAILLLAFCYAAYTTFFGPRPCVTFECFQSAMKSCKQTSYINEEQIASWQYNILGKKDDACEINVKLLNAKEGDLELNKYIGDEMVCSYMVGFASYPEKDLNSCHGLLKEGLQEIIIKKLHIYIIKNLGAIEQGLENITG